MENLKAFITKQKNLASTKTIQTHLAYITFIQALVSKLEAFWKEINTITDRLHEKALLDSMGDEVLMLKVLRIVSASKNVKKFFVQCILPGLETDPLLLCVKTYQQYTLLAPYLFVLRQIQSSIPELKTVFNHVLAINPNRQRP